MKYFNYLRRSSRLVPALALLVSVLADAEPLRYRGDYTHGHEVNIFCPAVNSQCYWLGPGTPDEVRSELTSLVAADSSKPYRPLCVVLEGEIDRDTPRDGFAADYDGLFNARRVLASCGENGVITQGDLQHHRWVLHSVNGQMLDSNLLLDRIPELEFGEQMHISGHGGCNRFSGRAVLSDDKIDMGQMMSTAMSCLAAQNDIESTTMRVLGSQPQITLEQNRDLVLRSADTVLRYRLRDRVE